jgi:hypothetical protein
MQTVNVPARDCQGGVPEYARRMWFRVALGGALALGGYWAFRIGAALDDRNLTVLGIAGACVGSYLMVTALRRIRRSPRAGPPSPPYPSPFGPIDVPGVSRHDRGTAPSVGEGAAGAGEPRNDRTDDAGG